MQISWPCATAEFEVGGAGLSCRGRATDIRWFYCCLLGLTLLWAAAAQSAAAAWAGPAALLSSGDGKTLYIAAERAKQVLTLDTSSAKVLRRAELPGAPTGLAWVREDWELVVTCSGTSNVVMLFNAKSGRIARLFAGGPGACSPVVSPNRKAVFVCNRFANEVALIDLRSGRQVARAVVEREPVCAALSPDGKSLAVANLLPRGVVNTNFAAAAVTFLDAATLRRRANVPLPNGSTVVRALAFHPRSNLVAVAHNISRFQIPTTQVEHGWMHVSALSLIWWGEEPVVKTVVLDDARRGAADPFAVAWLDKGSGLAVAHAGTHELSLIDYPALEQRLAAIPRGAVVGDFAFLGSARQRVALPGNGPRALTFHSGTLYAAEFFSDSIAVVSLADKKVIGRWSLAGGQGSGIRNQGTGVSGQESEVRLADLQREGERLFNDATIGHQAWQSCASCHPDGREDGLNWDLLNDGIGNPKNTKSLLYAIQTPPAMSSGVRASAEKAIRSGLRHILFAPRPEAEAKALDAYIEFIRPVPSPELASGKLTAQALRGKRLFEDPKVGCLSCHPPPLFTDRRSHVLSAPGGKAPNIDTPTLIECWRTAPYLHDGSAATLEEVLTSKNSGDAHGVSSHLSVDAIQDLAAYVRSL